MYQNRLLALLQLTVGGVATLLVVVGYFWFSKPLQVALVELDSMAGNAESEIETVEDLLTDIDGVAASLQRALPSHSRSVTAVSDSMQAVAKTVGEWDDEIAGFQNISTYAAQICDTFAEQLPIRVPTVKMGTKMVQFQLPKVISKTQEVEIPYPTATVQTATKRLSYPNGATVEMKGWNKSLGKVAGTSLGSLKLDYPSGISVSKGSVDLNYPSGISIGTENKTVTIPSTPEINMKDYSFEIPDQLEIGYRELLADEKVLLKKSSEQLASIHGSLGLTHVSLGAIKKLLEKDVQESLQETSKNLADAETALAVFRTERIPKVLSDLRDQRQGLRKSRGVFTAVSGLIPLAFAIIGLVTTAIAFSGGAKFLATSRASA